MLSLIISPFEAERTALVALLRSEGHEAIAATSHAEGLALAAAQHPDVIIADAQVPGLDGLALVRDLSAQGVMPHVILLCPRADHPLEPLGVVCLTKPIDFAALHRLLSQLAPQARCA